MMYINSESFLMDTLFLLLLVLQVFVFCSRVVICTLKIEQTVIQKFLDSIKGIKCIVIVTSLLSLTPLLLVLPTLSKKKKKKAYIAILRQLFSSHLETYFYFTMLLLLPYNVVSFTLQCCCLRRTNRQLNDDARRNETVNCITF